MTFEIFKMRFRCLHTIGSAYNIHCEKFVKVYVAGFVYFNVLLTKVGLCLTKDKLLCVRKRRPKQLGFVEKIFVDKKGHPIVTKTFLF